MKKILTVFLILTVNLLANDPTIPKGRLKKILFSESRETSPTPAVSPDKIQEDIDKIIFKGLFNSNSVQRVLVEFDKVNILLSPDKVIEINGNKFKVLKISDQIISLQHQETKTEYNFNYRK